MTEDLWSYIITGLGVLGSAIIVVAYFFTNQQQRLGSQHWLFPPSNLIGALLILVSLYFQPNLPALLIEIFWIAISIYGLAKSSTEVSEEGSRTGATEPNATQEIAPPEP